MKTKAIARAKINLCLHLTGLRADGYHLLESLVVFADFGDALEVAPSDALSLSVGGPFAKGVPVDGQNLVLKAVERLRDLRGVKAGAAIHLEKHLPHGGGIGGGSSDAACAIRLLANLWKVAPLTAAEALPLGADIPVCLEAPKPMFMSGIGELLSPAPMIPDCWLVMANPGVAVPTAKAFALHDSLYDFSPLGMAKMDWGAAPQDFATWLLAQRNDLTKVASAQSLAPIVSDVLAALRATKGNAVAEMSGSGSTCWGLYFSEEEAQTATDTLAANHPDWWVRASAIARA
ncbi:MAG: 4-diphosphocytidyl-2-C-methyl-D-erythritol kinase [Halocynthiibacter sp.]|jgi:4-diphosphocytidyl-2-C-methyl-D-erythritol kinase